MSRMTYFSAEETREVVRRLREGGFPCDVIHLDSGWFRTNWKCEWEFSPETFPNPEAFLAELLEKGIRVSLWQLPCVAKGTVHYGTARLEASSRRKARDKSSNRTSAPSSSTARSTSPTPRRLSGTRASSKGSSGWARPSSKLTSRAIEEDAEYRGTPYRLLHNLYPLLYQKAAYEVTERVRGRDEAMIWGRAGWIGCQRYPIHWEGLRLHLGRPRQLDPWWAPLRDFGLRLLEPRRPRLSRSAKLHELEAGERPLCQVDPGWVFSSHLRYHGASVREPYEYPEIAGLVRKWLNLRYALIPYLAEAGKEATRTGYPVLRALVFHHGDDPTCWAIDDEFYCGPSYPCRPIMNSEGIRDIYLPRATGSTSGQGRRPRGRAG